MPTSTGQFGGSTPGSAPLGAGLSGYNLGGVGSLPRTVGLASMAGASPNAGMSQAPAMPPPSPTAPQAGPNPIASSPPGQGGAGAPSSGAYGQNDFGIMPHVDLSTVANYLMNAHHLVESAGSGDYTARNPTTSASGKYQYTKGTWNNYGGFPDAASAPPEVQEQRMREDTMNNLNRYGGDPFKAGAAHYFPKYAGDPSKWNDPLIGSDGKPIVNKATGEPAPTVAQHIGQLFPQHALEAYMSRFGKK
jgi:Transglycosylase-like domain